MCFFSHHSVCFYRVMWIIIDVNPNRTHILNVWLCFIYCFPSGGLWVTAAVRIDIYFCY